jgi:hypothetical protein
MKEDKTRASFDQLGFVYSFKVGNTTSLRYVNFGFNYHKNKNFNRLFSAGGQLDGLSQSWQLAQEMTNAGVNSATIFDNILTSENPYRQYWNRYPVLGVLGATTGVVDWPKDETQLWGWNGYSNNFYSQEKGGINQYDFNIAFNIEDRIYLGATLGVYDVNYDRFTSYTEELDDDFGAENGGYTYVLKNVGPDGKETVLFDNSEVGGENITNKLQGLKQATNATGDYFFIQNLKAGQSGKTLLHIEFDGETEVNDYMDTAGKLMIAYAVEKDSAKTTTTSVKTGDQVKMWKLYALGGAALVAMILLIFSWRKDRKKGGEQA